jgi:D-arabinose 1-dehydrogenase-like Zn-dependent alcohol dehydrogenase
VNPEDVAPLTGAGLTPYRAIKKIWHILNANKNIAIIGMDDFDFMPFNMQRFWGRAQML